MALITASHRVEKWLADPLMTLAQHNVLHN
jgi:hypothetical protein